MLIEVCNNSLKRGGGWWMADGGGGWRMEEGLNADLFPVIWTKLSDHVIGN